MHELVARLIAADQLQGLRLDHIDGLLDPMQYTRRLQQLIRRVRGGERRKPFYVVVEKILADGEPMPAFPGVAGHHRLRMAQHDLARAGRSGRPRQARRAVARDRAGASRFRGRAGERQASRARHHHGERVQRAGAIAEPHRRRPFQHARLFGRPAARGVAALCPRISALSHLRDGGRLHRQRPRHHRAHHRGGAAALAGHRRRHLQFPSRRADARSDPRRPALQPAAGAQLRAEDAAVHRADGGEVARGHRVLSLSRAARR